MQFKNNKHIFEASRGETSKEIIYDMHDKILELKNIIGILGSENRVNSILISTLVEIVLQNNLTTEDDFYNIFNRYADTFEKDSKEMEKQKNADFIKKVMLKTLDENLPAN